MISKSAILLISITFVIVLGGCTPIVDTTYPTFGIPWLEEIRAVEDYAIYDVEWSPNGELIAMVGYRGTVGQDALVFDMNTQSSQVILGEENCFLSNSVTWSTNGEFLVVTGGYSTDQTTSGLWLVPLSGDTPTFLTNGIEASWSPKGDILAIQESLSDDILLIKLLNINTGSENILVEMRDERGSSGIHIEWSPDSELIAFTSDIRASDGSSLIAVPYLIDPDLPEPLLLFPDLSLELWDLAWFPDGEWMALIDRSEGNYQLQLTSIEEECFIPLWPEARTSWMDVDVSPDGTKLVVSNGDAYIIDLEAMSAEGLIDFPLRCP
jgi:Tol biopolymer transport system component